MKLEEQKRGWLSHVLEVRNAGVVDLLALEVQYSVLIVRLFVDCFIEGAKGRSQSM